jgi:hypothetical protein
LSRTGVGALRDRSAGRSQLESNRLELVRLQWQCSYALIGSRAPCVEYEQRSVSLQVADRVWMHDPEQGSTRTGFGTEVVAVRSPTRVPRTSRNCIFRHRGCRLRTWWEQLLIVTDEWMYDLGGGQLPDGVFDLRSALINDLYDAGRGP